MRVCCKRGTGAEYLKIVLKFQVCICTASAAAVELVDTRRRPRPPLGPRASAACGVQLLQHPDSPIRSRAYTRPSRTDTKCITNGPSKNSGTTNAYAAAQEN